MHALVIRVWGRKSIEHQTSARSCGRAMLGASARHQPPDVAIRRFRRDADAANYRTSRPASRPGPRQGAPGAGAPPGTRVGATSPQQTMSIAVALKVQDQHGLDTFLHDLYDLGVAAVPPLPLRAGLHQAVHRRRSAAGAGLPQERETLRQRSRHRLDHRCQRHRRADPVRLQGDDLRLSGPDRLGRRPGGLRTDAAAELSPAISRRSSGWTTSSN